MKTAIDKNQTHWVLAGTRGTLYNDDEIHYPNGDIKWIDEEGRAHLMRFRWARNWPEGGEGFIESLNHNPLDLGYLLIESDEKLKDIVPRPSGGIAWYDDKEWHEVPPVLVNQAIWEIIEHTHYTPNQCDAIGKYGIYDWDTSDDK